MTDEERLVALRKNEESFSVAVPESVQPPWIDAGTEIDWRPIEGGDVPRLVFGRIDPEDREAATEPRTPTTEDDALVIDVPHPLVGDAGLELDPDAYDTDNPLLLEPSTADDAVATDSQDRGPAAVMDEAMALTPVRFDDGTPYRTEPVSEVSEDSDPVAEAELNARDAGSAPRPETVSAPIDPAIIEGVVDGEPVPREALIEALETLARRDILDPADTAAGYGPFTVDERVIGIVDSERWDEEIASELATDDETVITAARRAHNRQAEALLRDAGSEGYHHANEPYDAVVIGNPTTPATE